ncbi:hypothetical protein FRC07_001866 [Ceratobasidium sp. 392]|nr:hypothetical protein FRC07_001866 [Ceratobasidium sp. 392]
MIAHGGPLKRKRSELDSSDDKDATNAATVLLALPMLVSYPPDHPMHIPGLRASLKALRQCTGINNGNESTEDEGVSRKRAKNEDGRTSVVGETMTPELEVRAWMALAEIGMMVLNARCSRWGESDESAWQWTAGVEQDIDTALLKGVRTLALATSLPSLRAYKDPLTLLSARAATPKRAIKILTTLLASTSSFPPTKHTYEAYLALADLHLYPPGGGGKLNLGAGLHVLSQLRTRAEDTGDVAVAQLATVAMMRARVVFCTDGVTEDIGSEKLEDSLRKAEAELGITASQAGATESGGAEQEKTENTTVAKTVMGDVSNRAQPSNTSSSPFIPTQPSAAPPSKPYPPTPNHSSTPAAPPAVSTEPEPSYIQHLRAHILFLGITLFTYLGHAGSTAKRVARVHAILDSGLLEYESEVCFCGMRTGEDRSGGTGGRKEVPTVDKLGVQPDGEEEEEERDTCPCVRSFVLPIPLSEGDKLMVRTTHPRVMFELAFLVSSVSRRDVVGRKPRRMVFASEGVRASEEMGIDVAFPVWATLRDMQQTELRLAEIRADLLCELVAIATMRSEFDAAEQRLAELVAHARNFGLFETFVGRIALHHAHLAHARGREERAISCYEATIRSSQPGSYIHTSARASLHALQLGVSARSRHLASPNTPAPPPPQLDSTILAACTHSLSPLAHILRAPGLPIVRAKEQLKLALDGATRAQDNYTRALAVAMSASHYMHTAENHAGTMLGTVKQLAAGMGAVEKGETSKKGGNGSVGNAPLGLWVGLRLSELYKRAGDAEQAKKQDAKNKKLLKAVSEIEESS